MKSDGHESLLGGGGGVVGSSAGASAGSCENVVSSGSGVSRCVAAAVLGLVHMLLLFPLWLNIELGQQFGNEDRLVQAISAFGVTSPLLGALAFVTGVWMERDVLGDLFSGATLLSYVLGFACMLSRFHDYTPADFSQGQAFVYGNCAVFVMVFLLLVAAALSRFTSGKGSLAAGRA